MRLFIIILLGFSSCTTKSQLQEESPSNQEFLKFLVAEDDLQNKYLCIPYKSDNTYLVIKAWELFRILEKELSWNDETSRKELIEIMDNKKQLPSTIDEAILKDYLYVSTEKKESYLTPDQILKESEKIELQYNYKPVEGRDVRQDIVELYDQNYYMYIQHGSPRIVRKF